jgi:hypothetical protein
VILITRRDIGVVLTNSFSRIINLMFSNKTISTSTRAVPYPLPQNSNTIDRIGLKKVVGLMKFYPSGASLIIVILFASIALPWLLFTFSVSSSEQTFPLSLRNIKTVPRNTRFVDEEFDGRVFELPQRISSKMNLNLSYSDPRDRLKECLNLWIEKDSIFKVNRANRKRLVKEYPHRWSLENRQVFEPYRIEYPVDLEMRVGSITDGGKHLVNPRHLYEERPCLVYSVGSNDESSFEQSLLQVTNHACEIHTFDPTLDPRRKQHMLQVATKHGFFFHDAGFARKSMGKYDNLQGFMKQFNHVNRTIDILKVDCEGCEFEFFPEVVNSIKRKEFEIGILNVELHLMRSRSTEDEVHQFFEMMDSIDMRLYNKDPNVIGCMGVHCSEFSWISAKEAFHSFILYRCPEFKQDWNSLWTELNS